jgi:hypothetical protein
MWERVSPPPQKKKEKSLRKKKALKNLLKPFEPKPWVCDVFSLPKNQEEPRRRLSRSSRPVLKETFYFHSKEEAEELAKRKTEKFYNCAYRGVVRRANPKDLCAQRLEDIQDALLEFLEKTLQSEEAVLAYDTQTFGKPNLSGFAEPIQEALELTFEGPQSPEEMGWVGSDGLP